MLWCQILTNPEWNKKLQTVLKDSGVEQRVRSLISYGIRTWAGGENADIGGHVSEEWNVFHEQGLIGWGHLLGSGSERSGFRLLSKNGSRMHFHSSHG